jgi:hypothetical protein
MPELPDFFRDYGIIPHGVPPPSRRVRAYLPRGHVVGQYIAVGLLSAFGLGIGVLFALTLPSPVNVLACAGILVCCGWLVYVVGRNDYVWVELDGDTLRARHLYTRRVIERPIEKIDDLFTIVAHVHTAESMITVAITDAWLGRVRGVAIRFRDKRTPLRISRTDPAMRNAKELIEAVIYRMSERGEVDAEIITFRGKPLIRRIYWKDGPDS